jgi:hypothetical protein
VLSCLVLSSDGFVKRRSRPILPYLVLPYLVLNLTFVIFMNAPLSNGRIGYFMCCRLSPSKSRVYRLRTEALLRKTPSFRFYLTIFFLCLFFVPVNQVIIKEEYIEVQIKMCKALFDPDEWVKPHSDACHFTDLSSDITGNIVRRHAGRSHAPCHGFCATTAFVN